MSHEPNEQPKLTALIGAELRALPVLSAPATLQARVFAELARRQALPWWRQSFRAWPVAAQFAFAVAALGLIQLLLGSPVGPALQGLTDSLAGLPGAALRAAQAVSASAAVFGSVMRDLLAALPPGWLLAAVMALGSSVLLLLGSGALIYRTLQTRH